MLGSLPCSRNMSDLVWDGIATWYGWVAVACRLKQNLGGTKPIVPCNAIVVPDLLGLLFT